MPPRSNTTSRLPGIAQELYDLATSLKDTPYGDLARAIADAGYINLLRETEVQPAYSGAVLVSFDLFVGKGLDSLERLDQVTVAVAPGPGPVSAAARLVARDSVIFMLTGRLPPQPTAAAAPAGAVQGAKTNGTGETHVDMGATQDDVVLPGETSTLQDTGGNLEPESVVLRRDGPDGLPIFKDVYAIGVPQGYRTTSEIVDAVLADMKEYIDTAPSNERLLDLYKSNDETIQFIKDMGDKEQMEYLVAQISRRRNELERPAGAPRRRQAAVPRAN